ncbi:enoyl-CoA hydratase/isomerase family protein [Actibacterium lipolyticum]|uniref:3-hydroxyisobutyryl-CoA hydrolase n=1 Tax=Actibacterium lipolyticum TaxID=1524263 RepID=A0A238KJ64_9RHOB|nr:enoyl-CoA hydratase/isomerase family protein [Actibacterium lipolyticum]SMX42714.1 putative enoyl-CoA hydratase echA8 [Actibacterium lipolyticum]
MGDIDIRIDGKVGRITLTRPQALNALSYEMCLKIEAALDTWRDDDAVAMILLDALGERAFCAGGDIAKMYETGRSGAFDYGQKFWRDEYRMNAKLFEFPKPVVSLLQGFTMGGGVGVGCHGSHRVVGESSQIAMPECGIGLVPDVGGSLLLARAPGRLGEYLGTTCARMNAGDAIHAGFADYFVPEARWQKLTATLTSTGDWTAVDQFAETPPDAPLCDIQPDINRHFAGETLGDIIRSLRTEDTEFAAKTLKSLGRASPLSMACTVEMLHRLRGQDTIRAALAQEFRFTFRALEHSDFLEGIRAAIIDKDKSPRWQHADMTNVPAMDVSKMLMPLGADELKLEEELA